jgi:hypothetical protein
MEPAISHRIFLRSHTLPMSSYSPFLTCHYRKQPEPQGDSHTTFGRRQPEPRNTFTREAVNLIEISYGTRNSMTVIGFALAEGGRESLPRAASGYAPPASIRSAYAVTCVARLPSADAASGSTTTWPRRSHNSNALFVLGTASTSQGREISVSVLYDPAS